MRKNQQPAPIVYASFPEEMAWFESEKCELRLGPNQFV